MIYNANLFRPPATVEWSEEIDVGGHWRESGSNLIMQSKYTFCKKDNIWLGLNSAPFLYNL